MDTNTINTLGNSTNSTDKITLITFGVFFAICLVCYIIALIRTKKKQMVTFVNWWEFFGSTIGCIVAIIGAVMLMSADAQKSMAIGILVVGLALVLLCAWFCLKANNGNIINTIVATLAKFFVMFIAWYALMALFEKPSEGDTYSSYRIKNGIAVAIAAFLLFSLVGSGKHEKLVETLKV